MFTQWLRNWIRTRTARTRRPAKKQRRAGFRPNCQNLEERTVFAFLAPFSTGTGLGYSNSSATGDFNGDGYADVVTVGNISGRGTVSVSLGNGDGSFQAAILTNSGSSNPLQVRVADFDGDGHDDVVTLGSYYIDSLTVLKGNGDGTFQPARPYSYSIPPTEIEVGDINGDGHPDLIEGNHFFNTTSVQLNDGLGGFAAKVDSAGVISPNDVAIADFNGDGLADLVSTSLYGSGVNVQLGSGNGTLRAPRSFAAGGSAVNETVADFNGDGRMDVAVSNNSYTNGISVLLGNGDGTFAVPTTYNIGAAPLSMGKGDFNGDGIVDLVQRTGSGFAVELGNGDGTFQSASLVSAVTGNTLVAADFNHDGVTDVGETAGGTLNVSMNDTAPLVGPTIGSVNFAIATPATTVAGQSVPVTITVLDADGNVIPDYAGTVRVFSNDPKAGGTGVSYTFSAVDGGVHTITTGPTLFSAGTMSILASAPFVASSSARITVTPAAATRLAITAPATAVAGAPTTFSIVALDAYNNMGAPYTGTVHFSSSDAQASLPADYTFTADDAGLHAFTASLATVVSGGQRITVTDTAAATITGTSSAVAVTPTAAASLSLVGGGGHIGSAHAVTVTARDVYGNVATGFSGTVHLTASDPNMVLPADQALVNGSGTLFVTPMTLGAQTISAAAVSDATIAGTESVLGTAGDAAKFVVTGFSATQAGTAQNVTITAYDNFGNVAVDYAGTVLFSSSDLKASMPFYTFTAADNGRHTFSVTLKTAGVQSLSMRDWYNAAINYTLTGITVTPAAGAALSVTPAADSVAGTSQTVTVTARDAYGNLATGYRGTVNFSSSDTIAALPAAYAFTAADQGVHSFSLAFKSSGGQTLVVTDSLNPLMTSSQRDIHIAAAAMTGFSFRSPSNTVSGTAFTAVLQAVDQYGNVVTGYTGKVRFAGPSGGGNVLPQDYTFTAADQGAHAFTFTLVSTGTQTINVQDSLLGSLKASFSIKVNASGSVSGGGTATGGGGGGGGSGGGGKKV